LKTAPKTTDKEIQIGLLDEPKGIIRMEIDPEAINQLAESIRSMGQLQAILVRPDGDRFEIVYGHRRFLACQKLGMTKIRASVKALDDITCALMRATENVERQDISPIEEAAVYADLFENLGLTVDEIGRRMGKSSGIVKRRLDLLRMPPCLQQAVHKKSIGYSVAEELWSLGDLPDIEYFLAFAIDHGATQSVVRQWVKEKKDERRRQSTGTEGSREPFSPMESRPIYGTCDTCLGALEIGTETIIRVCKSCAKIIESAMEDKK